ncbi:hypothetical protein [Flavobacterium sp.]|uniref:hypothetical protein n=1 Tax=Flavobacterium sp. TaxID=239 RepID=UPI00286E6551|nr:hypothetical protein [Flavobacterium sp.]
MKKPNTIILKPLFIICFSFSLVLVSCSKEDNPDAQPIGNNVTIHTAGSKNATATSRSIAQYWENGTPTDITNGTFDAVAESIVVTENGDKHIAGYEKNTNDNTVAKYWKNGIVTSLPATILGQSSSANDLAVSGNDVYISGNEDSDNGNSIAIYWKNNVKEYLSSSTNDTNTTAIAVANNKSYVSGYEKNGNVSTAYIWINGIATSLSPGSHNSQATDIFVVGTKVYVSGSELLAGKTVALYWECDTANGLNFTVHYLSDALNFALATSITVIGNDVFTGGVENLWSKYWKNNTPADAINLTTTGDGIVYSLFALGTDIYTITFQDAVGCKYWKNGTQINTLSTINNGFVYDLYVTFK